MSLTVNVDRLFRHIREQRQRSAELQRMNTVLDVLSESVPPAQQTTAGYFVSLMQMVEQWNSNAIADALTVTAVLRLLRVVSKKYERTNERTKKTSNTCGVRVCGYIYIFHLSHTLLLLLLFPRACKIAKGGVPEAQCTDCRHVRDSDRHPGPRVQVCTGHEAS